MCCDVWIGEGRCIILYNLPTFIPVKLHTYCTTYDDYYDARGDFIILRFIIIIVAGCTLTAAAYDYDKHDEVDEASSLFNGPIEVVATHPEMVWPEMKDHCIRNLVTMYCFRTIR